MIAVAAALAFLFSLNAVLAYWVPFLFLKRVARSTEPEKQEPASLPFLVILIPCHNGAVSLPGILKCLQRQSYPKDRCRVLVLADNCTDASADTARSFGVDVYERKNPGRMGKTYALNEVLNVRLRHEAFDALLLFDVDSRFGDEFLTRVARHVSAEAAVLQGAPYSKNPNQNALTQLGDLIQALVRVHQSGCQALGLYPIAMGGFGTTLTRKSLERLEWHIADDVTADDLELELRCCLRAIPFQYVADLHVFHDMPDDPRVLRTQRRRWISNSLRLAPRYGFSLLADSFQGNWKAAHLLFGFLLCPSFSLLFLWLAACTLVLGFLSGWTTAFFPWALAMGFLWGLHGLYLLLALRHEHVPVTWRHVQSVPFYLWVKLRSFVEGVLFVRSKEWMPTPHKSDAEMGFKEHAP